MLVRLALVLALVALVAGCGDDAAPDGAVTPPAAAVDAGDSAVRRRAGRQRRDASGRSRLERDGSTRETCEGIARLFRLPAYVAQGQTTYRLTTREHVRLWHSGLPCSGHIVSIEIDGRFATAVFRLGHGRRTRCDAPGTLAAARFEIVKDQIRSWEQIPVQQANHRRRPRSALSIADLRLPVARLRDDVRRAYDVSSVAERRPSHSKTRSITSPTTSRTSPIPSSAASRPETSDERRAAGQLARGLDPVRDRDHRAQRLDPAGQLLERHVRAGDEEHRAGDHVREEAHAAPLEDRARRGTDRGSCRRTR